MNQYSLTISFTHDELKALDAQNLQVVLLHTPTEPQHAFVAWAVFTPYPNNVVTWNSNYGLYAAAASIKPGNIITMLDSTPTTSGGQSYDFTVDGYFEPSQNTTQPGAYQVNNLCTKQAAFTFGLIQDVTVDGEPRPYSVLNAVTGYPNVSIAFSPENKYAVLLASNVQAGQVLELSTQTVTTFSFATGQPSLHLSYDAQNGQFISADTAPASQTASSADAAAPNS